MTEYNISSRNSSGSVNIFLKTKNVLLQTTRNLGLSTGWLGQQSGTLPVFFEESSFFLCDPKELLFSWTFLMFLMEVSILEYKSETTFKLYNQVLNNVKSLDLCLPINIVLVKKFKVFSCWVFFDRLLKQPSFKNLLKTNQILKKKNSQLQLKNTYIKL